MPGPEGIDPRDWPGGRRPGGASSQVPPRSTGPAGALSDDEADDENWHGFHAGFEQSSRISLQNYLSWLRLSRLTFIGTVTGVIFAIVAIYIAVSSHQAQQEEMKRKQVADAEKLRMDRLSRLTFATAADDADVFYVCSSKEPLGLALKDHLRYINKCRCDHRIGHGMDNTCMIAAQQR